MAFGIPEGYEEIDDEEDSPIPEGYEPAGEGFLWRNEIISELDEDPETKLLTMQMLDTEGGEAATMESLVNRTAMIREKIPGWTINDELHSGFYGPINRGEAQTREIGPSKAEKYQQDIEKVRAGSNIIEGRTDQGWRGDPNWRGPGRVYVPEHPGEIYNHWTGDRGGVKFTHEDSAEFAAKVNSGAVSQAAGGKIPEGYEEIPQSAQVGKIPEGYEEIGEEKIPLEPAAARPGGVEPGKKSFFATREEEIASGGKGPNYPVEGTLESGNIDLSKRPQVKNPDGSISTVRSISFEEDGQQVLIPTVVGNKVVSEKEAIANYHKTGEHLGKFDTVEAANAAAEALHKSEEAKLTPQQAKGTANRKELSGAIAKVEKEGYVVPHFIDLPNEPEGDRAPTRDMEQLVATLATKETNAIRAQDTKQAAQIRKERNYWENKIKTEGMSAEQWKKQTGEEDPRYPHEPAFTAKQSPEGLIDNVETAINAGKEAWESAKRGLMSSGLGLGETVNRYAYSPIVHGIREAIDYIAPGSDLAKGAKKIDDEFYKHTVAIPAAQRAQLAKESAAAGTAGEIGHAVGTMAGDLPQIMLSSGLLPELKTGMELVNTLGHGAAAMTVPAMRAGMDAAEEVKKQGGDNLQQFGAFVRGASITAGIGAIPMATKSGAPTAVRRVIERAVKSIPLASAAVESGRMLDNAVSDIFGGQKRPFSLAENIKGTLPLALVGGVAGRDTRPSKFERTFGFSPDKLDKADFMRRRMEAEGIAKATPEKVMEWDAEWKKQEGVWPEEAPPATPEAPAAAPEPTFPGPKRSAQALGIVADPRSQKGFQALHDEAKNIADYLNKAEHWGPWNSAVGNFVASNQKAQDNVIRQAETLKALVPSESERKGATMYREADGNMAKITGWGANVKDADAKNAYRSAGAMTAKGKELVGRVAQRFKELNMWLNANGIDVAERENYITHMLQTGGVEPGTAMPLRSLSSFFRYSKPRTYDSFFQAFQAGEKPKTLDIVDILSAYELSAQRAVNNKKFVDRLKFGQARDGNPIVGPQGIELRNLGYKPIDAPGLERQLVHPEHHKDLSKILGKSRVQEWLEERSKNPFVNIGKGVLRLGAEAQKYAKGTMFSLSLFHHITEGTHALGHKVNPFSLNTKKIDLNDPAQYDAAVHGLMLRPDKASQEQFMTGVGGKSSYNLVTKLARRSPFAIDRKIADMIDGYSQYLFESYIPRLKMDTYEHILERNTDRFAGDLKSGKVSPSMVKSLSADQANAAYGHLNYTKMARSPTMQHVAQLMFLAPDFFEARAKFTGQAARGLVGSKTGREQLIALSLLAGGQYVVARILNKLDHDDYEWDPEHAFQVKTDLGGILPADRWVGLRSVPEDIVKAGFVSLARGDIKKAGEEAFQFVRHRFSPFMSFATDNISQYNWKGEKTDFGKSLGDMLSNIVPMPGQGYVNNLVRPNEAQSISPFETLLKSTGVQIHRVSPLSDAHELAENWLKVNDPEEYARREASTFPSSKYVGLRYALEDGDWEAARKWAKKLREGGATPETFQQSLMKPFTKSLADDQRLYKSLDKHDKAIFDAALERRAEVLKRYREHVNPRAEVERVTKETLHRKMREAEIRDAKEKRKKRANPL